MSGPPWTHTWTGSTADPFRFKVETIKTGTRSLYWQAMGSLPEAGPADLATVPFSVEVMNDAQFSYLKELLRKSLIPQTMYDFNLPGEKKNG